VEPLAVRPRRVEDTLVAVHLYSHSLEDLEEASLSVLERVYRVEGPGYVELHLYPDRAVMESNLSRLALEAGVAVEAEYVLVHEAWAGVPRIHVPQEALGDDFFEAMLGHEAVHSVLHGGLEYYMVEPPGSDAAGLLAAQLAATTVKDLEVHGWAAAHGLSWLLEGQMGYWSRILPRLACRGPEELGDALRGSTAWLAAGEEPPLSPVCMERLTDALGLLQELLTTWRRGGPRPWSRVAEAAVLIRRLLVLEAQA